MVLLFLFAAILAPGKRTVTSLPRIAGLSRERRFTTYHRFLNRAVWGPWAARLLLGLLVVACAPSGPPCGHWRPRPGGNG